MSEIPFWDQAAYSEVSTRDPQTGVTSSSRTTAPGIWSHPALDGWQVPWPAELSQWETIVIAGIRAPGICRVDGGRRRRIDHKEMFGASGMPITDGGLLPAQFTITITIWTWSQLVQLGKLYQLLMPKPSRPLTLNPTIANANITAGPNSQLFPNQVPNMTNNPVTMTPPPAPPVPLSRTHAFSVHHPAFALIGVTDVYVVDFRVPRPAGPQIMECVIDVEELYQTIEHGAAPLNDTVDVTRGTNGDFSAPASIARRAPVADPSTTSTGT